MTQMAQACAMVILTGAVDIISDIRCSKFAIQLVTEKNDCAPCISSKVKNRLEKIDSKSKSQWKWLLSSRYDYKQSFNDYPIYNILLKNHISNR